MALFLAVFSLLAITALASAHGGPQIAPDLPQRITVELSQGFSPYYKQRYDIRPMSKAIVVSIEKHLAARAGILRANGLIHESELKKFWQKHGKELEPSKAAADSGETSTPTGHHHQFEIKSLSKAKSKKTIKLNPEKSVVLKVNIAKDSYTWNFVSSASSEDAPQEFVRAFIRFATTHANTVPFVDRYYAAGTAGFLTAKSRPEAEMWVDGARTFLLTPTYSYPLLPGKHKIDFEPENSNLRFSYEITIQRGVTTLLDVELK